MWFCCEIWGPLILLVFILVPCLNLQWWMDSEAPRFSIIIILRALRMVISIVLIPLTPHYAFLEDIKSLCFPFTFFIGPRFMQQLCTHTRSPLLWLQTLRPLTFCDPLPARVNGVSNCSCSEHEIPWGRDNRGLVSGEFTGENPKI